MKQQQEKNLVIKNDISVANKYFSDFECDLYLFCENITREIISKRKNELEDKKSKVQKVEIDEPIPVLQEIKPIHQNPVYTSNIPPPPPPPSSSFLYSDYVNTLPRQYANCRGELLQSEEKKNDWKDEDDEKEKEKGMEIEKDKEKKQKHQHHRSNSNTSNSSYSISDVEEKSKNDEETSSYSSYSTNNDNKSDDEEREKDNNNDDNNYNKRNDENENKIKPTSSPSSSSSSLLPPQNTARSYRLNQELYARQVKTQRCPIQFVLIRYRGYSSFLHAIKSCVWGTNKGIAISLQELYNRGSHVLLCFTETKSNAIQGIASMTSPIYICKTKKHYNFCHIFRIHWNMIHTVKFSELPFFDVKDIRLEIDFESGRDILNIMSGGIHAKQEKVLLTNNMKLQNPWKYKYLRQESLNREILKQKIRYDMLQYDTAKIYGLSGYLLPNIKFIMNPFLPHDNPQKSSQRY